MRVPKLIFGIIVTVNFFLCQHVLAQIVINEIMYNPVGNDTGREWVELYNGGSDTVTMLPGTKGWKFSDGSNHVLVDPASGVGRGSLAISPGGYVVLLNNDSVTDFLAEYPGGSYSIIKSAFSLKNSGDNLILNLFDDSGKSLDTADYKLDAEAKRAFEDGNSLQKVGGVWKALKPTPGILNVGEAESAANSPDQNGNVASDTTAASSTDSVSQNNYSTWPVEPRVFSRIIGPTTAIVGADIILKGEAIGVEKQPLQNVRFVWNFGDAVTKEGESVMHGYNFPGDYVVILEASSGRFVGANRLKIKVIPADLVISEVALGVDGKIELLNNSNSELDLSWWRVKNGGQFFTIPKNTIILAHGRLPLASSVLGFAVVDSDVALLYPNGSVARAFEKNIAVKTSSIAAAASESKKTVNKPVAVASPSKAKTLAVTTVKEIPKPPDESPKIVEQTASVAFAVGTSSEKSVVNSVGTFEKPGKKGLSLWLYGVCGVIILGLGFALFPKSAKSFPPKNSADEYKIIED